jgi:hypothetical protein
LLALPIPRPARAQATPTATATATATPTAVPTAVALAAGTTTIVSSALTTHQYQMQLTGNSGNVTVESGAHGTNCAVSATALGGIGPGNGFFYIVPPTATLDFCAVVSGGTPAMAIQ